MIIPIMVAMTSVHVNAARPHAICARIRKCWFRDFPDAITSALLSVFVLGAVTTAAALHWLPVSLDIVTASLSLIPRTAAVYPFWGIVAAMISAHFLLFRLAQLQAIVATET